jgi:hypothetical protein
MQRYHIFIYNKYYNFYYIENNNTRNKSGISKHPCIILYVIRIVIFIISFLYIFVVNRY